MRWASVTLIFSDSAISRAVQVERLRVSRKKLRTSAAGIEGSADVCADRFALAGFVRGAGLRGMPRTLFHYPGFVKAGSGEKRGQTAALRRLRMTEGARGGTALESSPFARWRDSF